MRSHTRYTQLRGSQQHPTRNAVSRGSRQCGVRVEAAALPVVHRSRAAAKQDHTKAAAPHTPDNQQRRSLLFAAAAAITVVPWFPAAAPQAGAAPAASAVVAPASVQLSLAPDQSGYDASDPELRAAARLIQEALNATDVRQEEALWTQIIDT